MVRVFAIISIILLNVIMAQSHVAANTASQPSDIMRLGKEWFYRFETNNIDRAQLDANMKRQLTPKLVKQERDALLQLGKPVNFFYVNSERIGIAKAYNFGIIFKNARVVESIVVNRDGKIAGIGFQIFVKNGIPADSVSGSRS